MNQIIKQVNTIICFKIQKKSHACVLRILNLQFVYRGAVKGFRVKRDRPNLFSVIRNLKKIKFVNRE